MNEKLKNCKALAYAIIVRTVKDYKKALIMRKKGILKAQDDINEIEKFFKSAWFKKLTNSNFDGEKIIKIIRSKIL